MFCHDWRRVKSAVPCADPILNIECGEKMGAFRVSLDIQTFAAAEQAVLKGEAF